MFTYQSKLIEVIDGDTVDLLDLGFGIHVKERFRLYGIDAPEMPTEAGKIAKANLESLMVPYPYIATVKMTKRPQEKTDKYGRYLAILYDDLGSLEVDAHEMSIAMRPTSLNWRMIATGKTIASRFYQFAKWSWCSRCRDIEHRRESIRNCSWQVN